MARLVLDTGGKYREVFELGAGTNRIGRSEQCDFHLDHSSVSGFHCELVLSAQGVLLRDCNSTNGTKVDGRSITEAWLTSGQVIHIGALKLIVEINDASVNIPRIEVNIPKPPVVLEDGSTLCRRHPKSRATHRCTHCKELLCDVCVHRLRRKGGKLHLFCAVCSHDCEPLGDQKQKKKSFLALFKRTIRIPFSRKKGEEK